MQKYLTTNVLLLKNNIDTIISDTKINYNKTGNPGMTVGGTGDILSGLAAGFVAQKNTLLDSASAAAYLSGYIGDQLFEKFGYSFIASDFLDRVGIAIKSILDEN